MLLLSLLLLAGADGDDGLAKKMLPIYTREAAEYSIAIESAPKQALELKKEPIFEWSNPVREGLQQGAVFLWLRDGRPAAIGDFFSEPEGRTKGRKVMHEFHALEPEKLLVTRPKGALNEWKPEAGLARKELSDAPAPAPTPEARLIQMRKLAQEFTGHETDNKGEKWELRLLPAPLYRYPTAKTGIIDGALFTLVSTAGTDPEVLLLIEAKETDGKMHWEYACGRYSDRSLYVQRKDKEVWSMVRSETNTFLHDPQHLFRVYPDKVVDLEGKLLARVRATEKEWWGQFLPRKTSREDGGTTMYALSFLLLVSADDTADTLGKKMLPICVKEASDYSIAVEGPPKKELEFKKEPVFEWSNPIREGVQQGVVFLWLRDGRPAALASIFSQPHDKPAGRQVIHELHALDTEKLVVTRPKGVLNEWKPEAGFGAKELPDAGVPAETAAARLVQMRRLAQDFAGHTVDRDSKKWELRLLPAPLYRYPTARTGVIDGALFTLVSTAGTDPEVLLLIEAKEAQGKVRWEYALGRFSDRDLYVQRKDKEVWSSVRNETNTFLHDDQHTYRLYADKVVSPEGKLLARMQATPEMWWGKVIPVEDKP